MRLEHRELALEAQHGRGDQGAARQHAGIGHQETGREIVGAVADEVVAARSVAAALSAVRRHGVRLDPDPRVDRAAPPRPPNAPWDAPIRAVVWAICRCRLDSSTRSSIDDADRADAGRGEIQHQRRAEPARADHQHPRRLELGLADAAHLLQQDVAGVAADFVFGRSSSMKRAYRETRTATKPCGLLASNAP